MTDRMGIWAALTEEQLSMMVTATDEAAVAHILDDFRARQRWAETGSTMTPSDLDVEAKLAMIPHFAGILADLVDRGWIELFQGYPTKGSVKLTAAEVAAVINEPESWVYELEDWKVVGTCTGDDWDRLIGEQ